MKLIGLTQGKFAKVDDDWFDYLNQWKWYCNSGYTERKDYTFSPPRHIPMHRVIINPVKGTSVDDINGDKLDNCKSNLRLCNHSTNAMNMRKHRGSSIYKGVVRNENSWRVQITMGGNGL